MTIAQALSSPVVVPATAPIMVAWRVSRAAWPFPLLTGTPDPELAFRIEMLGANQARVCVNMQRPGQPGSCVPASVRHDGDLLHIDAPGMLTATLRHGVVLYAFTSLFATLGIAGGRYELAESSPAASG